jgi:hypothetical protein
MSVHPYALAGADETQLFVCWVDDDGDGSEQTLDVTGVDTFPETGEQLPGDGDEYAYHAHVTGLTAGTTYAASIGALEFSIRTLPSALPGGGLRIGVISDIHIDAVMTDDADFQTLADYEPDLVLLVGDILTWADGDGGSLTQAQKTAQYVRFFADYVSRLNTVAGHLVPLVNTPSNHDVGNHNWDGTGAVTPDAGYYQLLWPSLPALDPVGENYASVKAGYYLQVLALDTHSALPLDTGAWIASAIDPEALVCIPIHHSPLLPGTDRLSNDPDLQERLRNAWCARLYAAPNVRATFCGHIHTRKVSRPWALGTGAGAVNTFDANGEKLFAAASGSGIVEFGDGWQEDRPPDNPRWYLEGNEAVADKQWYAVTIATNSMTVEERDDEGALIASHSFPTTPRKVRETLGITALRVDGETRELTGLRVDGETLDIVGVRVPVSV